MKKPTLAAVLLLSLTACGRTDDLSNAEAARSEGLKAQEELQVLPSAKRNAVFIRAIREAGLDCQQVESSVLIGYRDTQPVWTATCSDKRVWTILIAGDGVAQILNAQEAAGLKLERGAARQSR